VPQNIYDDPAFFAGYAQLERFGRDWFAAMEHADFASLLPTVEGARVLDLGCGAGQLSLFLADAGAAEVIATDLSETMLRLAESDRSHPRINYRRAAMEDLDFPPDRFDLVVSSLALHYVEDYAGLMQRIASWLTPGGVLVFSTEHPIYMAGFAAAGWAQDAAGRKLHWTLDDYGVEGLREGHWFVNGVQKYHRTMATLLNGPITAGLTIERLIEPVPTDDMLQQRPHWAEELRRPTFLLVRARKV